MWQTSQYLHLRIGAKQKCVLAVILTVDLKDLEAMNSQADFYFEEFMHLFRQNMPVLVPDRSNDPAKKKKNEGEHPLIVGVNLKFSFSFRDTKPTFDVLVGSAPGCYDSFPLLPQTLCIRIGPKDSKVFGQQTISMYFASGVTGDAKTDML